MRSRRELRLGIRRFLLKGAEHSMQPTLCSRCHKNVAVIFISKLEGARPRTRVWLKCARELGIKPIDDMMKKMGISMTTWITSPMR